MSRDATKRAQQAGDQAQQISKGQKGRATANYKELFPQYMSEAEHPMGFTPEQRANIDTSNEQSIGGATAGAVGQGNLEAARTRNAGGFAPAIDESYREGARQLSQNAVGTAEEDALLQQANKQAGLSGLSDLYKTSTGSMLSALGLQNQSASTEAQAGQSGWFQNLLGTIGALKPSYSKGNYGVG